MPFSAASHFFLNLHDLPPLQFSWSGLASVVPDYLPRLVELGPNLIAGFACNGRGIAQSTAMGRELAALAIPLHPATEIPFHRFAPNALLPVSMIRAHLAATLR